MRRHKNLAGRFRRSHRERKTSLRRPKGICPRRRRRPNLRPLREQKQVPARQQADALALVVNQLVVWLSAPYHARVGPLIHTIPVVDSVTSLPILSDAAREAFFSARTMT